MHASSRRTPAHVRWACAFALAVSGSAVDAAPPTEIEVKAAFLYHFAQLVTWPDDATSNGAPIVLAVVGADPFGGSLEATIAKDTVRGRPIRIQRVARLADLSSDPHILFVARADRSAIDRAIDSVQRSAVLTVSDFGGFARRGGMIEFRLTPESRVAFDINRNAVESAGLKMSAQLLKIARVVESSP